MIRRATRNRTARRAGRDDRGAVLVIAALAMVALMVFVALVVDLGNARQQRVHAQALADASAVSGAGALSDSTPDPWGKAAYFAFASLGTTAGASASCGASCKSYADGRGHTLMVENPYQGKSLEVHVRICWGVPAAFAGVIGNTATGVCGDAVAHNTDGTGKGVAGPASAACTPNELANGTANPIATDGVTLTATFSASQPLDESSVVFISQVQTGQLVRLSKSADPTVGYTIVYTGGNTAVISHTLPSGLSTATGSLFVRDNQQKSCGQVAWSSCPVASHDNFFETNSSGLGTSDHGMPKPDNGDADDSLSGAALANAALLGDADDSVLPTPGTLATPGMLLGAVFHDEKPIDSGKVHLFLNGVEQSLVFTPALPANSTGDGSAYNQVSRKVSTVTKSGSQVTVTLTNYFGDPIQGKTVTVSASVGTVNPPSSVSRADGTAVFTLSNSGATPTAVDSTDAITITGGSAAVPWPNTATYLDSSGFFREQVATVLDPTSPTVVVGWNTAFLYVFDGDRNQAGGDCAISQYSFRFSRDVALIQ